MEQTILLAQSTSQNPLFGLAPIVIVVVIFYLLIFMPMRKRQKGQAEMIAGIKKNDRVVTSSGIYGVVADVKPKTFTIKIAENVKIEVDKNAIARLQGPEETQ